MKLKDYLREMTLPTVETAEDACAKIRQIAPLVMAGNIKGDYLGTLDAALKAIQSSTNPEAYARDAQMALKAKKMLQQHRSTLSVAQPQHTSMKPTDSFGK